MDGAGERESIRLSVSVTTRGRLRSDGNSSNQFVEFAFLGLANRVAGDDSRPSSPAGLLLTEGARCSSLVGRGSVMEVAIEKAG